MSPQRASQPRRAWSAALCAAVGLAGHAADRPAAADLGRVAEQIVVVGERNATPGSGHALETEELERFDHTDVHQVLAALPGVYVREEDGYGLRPNIGIRGAVAERSQKITLLEDGVPTAPAPYSAPAAYYTPNVSRMRRVEVLKGPAALHHGPHTVGGAINFVSRATPVERTAEIDATLGSDAFHKLAFLYGRPVGDAGSGFLVEGLRYASDGFKELDGGGDTGFVRNDVGLKAHWSPSGNLDQQITLKLGHADEDADETYLGLSDADFEAAPLRRYRSSQLARFRTEHRRAALAYDVNLEAAHLRVKAYWNRFDRQWNKLDGFVSGRSLETVLAAPRLHARAHALLTGAADSIPVDAETLDLTNHDRAYVSKGLQATATMDGELGDVGQLLTVGVRVHHDAVWRRHMPMGHLMESGALVWDGIDRRAKLRNRADTEALAVFVSEEFSWGDLSLTVGARHEEIQGAFEDLRHGATRESRQRATTPGIGVHWQATDGLGLLAGVYRGFSPAGPGASAEPEEALNYEYGLRYLRGTAGVELVGFLSDYDNLLGRCRVSDTGCVPGDEFNGGRVEVSGAELLATVSLHPTPAIDLEAELTYTYTESAFRDPFLSSFSQWGAVREGDELPYLPRHRGQLRLALARGAWEWSVAVRHQSRTREEPGDGRIADGLHADGYTTVDVALAWQLRDATRLQLVVGNAGDEVAIVSHRPFGARPNRPRWVTLRVRQRF